MFQVFCQGRNNGSDDHMNLLMFVPGLLNGLTVFCFYLMLTSWIFLMSLKFDNFFHMGLILHISPLLRR